MAINVERLVQGLVDFQNPQAKEDRRIAKGVLAAPMREDAQDAMNSYVQFSNDLATSVAKGHMTSELATTLRDAQMRLVLAQISYVEEFLDVKR